MVVPAGAGLAVWVRLGEHLRIVDVEGGQVGDLFAFAGADSGEYLSASHTRTSTSRLFPRIGEQFVTNRRRPILTLVALWSTFKHEYYYRHTFATKTELVAAVDKWMHFYNDQRHSVIGMLSPVAYEQSLSAAPQAA